MISEVEMNYLNMMKNRNSCRDFSDQPIDEEVLQRLLEASVCAPSSGGFQNYSIIKVTDSEKKQTLAKLCRKQGFIGKAPVNLVFCVDLHRERRIAQSCSVLPNIQYDYESFIMFVMDAAIAAQTLCMAAEAEGLGSVLIGNIVTNQKQVAELLNLPKQVLPVIMVSLGHRKNKGTVSGKYSPSIMVHEETYQERDITELQAAWKEKYADWSIKPNEKLMSRIGEITKEYFGEDYAAEGARFIREKNWVDPFSFWYGYYYPNHEGLMTPEDHIKFLEEQEMTGYKKK